MLFQGGFENVFGGQSAEFQFGDRPSGAPVFSGVIDQVGVSAQAAWSTRKLRTAYAGSALRVRRSSDNAELDIGFLANGDLNTTTLLAHCGAGQGFVVTWYDQSGNGNDVTQATALAQPQIVIGGSVHAINGKPAVNFDGLSWSLPRLGASFNMYLANTVHNPNSSAATLTMMRQEPTTSGLSWYMRINTGAVPVGFKSPTAISGSAIGLAPVVQSLMRTNGSSSDLLINGTSVATGAVLPTTATVGNFQIGVSPLGGQNYSGNISEAFIFNADLTVGQRQTLERNQGTYFGITVA